MGGNYDMIPHSVHSSTRTVGLRAITKESSEILEGKSNSRLCTGPVHDELVNIAALLARLPEWVYRPLDFLVELGRKGALHSEGMESLFHVPDSLCKHIVHEVPLGPFELHGVIPVISSLYWFSLAYPALSKTDQLAMRDNLEVIPKHTLWLLWYLHKATIPRALFNSTAGFRGFQVEYDKAQPYLSVSPSRI